MGMSDLAERVGPPAGAVRASGRPAQRSHPGAGPRGVGHGRGRRPRARRRPGRRGRGLASTGSVAPPDLGALLSPGRPSPAAVASRRPGRPGGPVEAETGRPRRAREDPGETAGGDDGRGRAGTGYPRPPPYRNPAGKGMPEPESRSPRAHPDPAGPTSGGGRDGRREAGRTTVLNGERRYRRQRGRGPAGPVCPGGRGRRGRRPGRLDTRPDMATRFGRLGARVPRPSPSGTISLTGPGALRTRRIRPSSPRQSGPVVRARSRPGAGSTATGFDPGGLGGFRAFGGVGGLGVGGGFGGRGGVAALAGRSRPSLYLAGSASRPGRPSRPWIDSRRTGWSFLRCIGVRGEGGEAAPGVRGSPVSPPRSFAGRPVVRTRPGTSPRSCTMRRGREHRHVEAALTGRRAGTADMARKSGNRGGWPAAS